MYHNLRENLENLTAFFREALARRDAYNQEKKEKKEKEKLVM